MDGISLLIADGSDRNRIRTTAPPHRRV